VKDRINVCICDSTGWRIFTAFGETIIAIVRIMTLPCRKVHLYQRNRNVDWPERFLSLLGFYNDGKIVLHKVGELPDGDFFNLKSGPAVSFLNPSECVDYLKIRNWDKIPYDKTLDNIDFSKVITWSARPVIKESRWSYNKNFVEVPQFILGKYLDFNFINVGAPLDSTITSEVDAKSSAIYDLHTTAWMIKKSHKFLGVDSGGTHFALTIKDPKDVLYYDKVVHLKNRMMYRNCYIKNGVTVVND
jgi:hypothetical protein